MWIVNPILSIFGVLTADNVKVKLNRIISIKRHATDLVYYL